MTDLKDLETRAAERFTEQASWAMEPAVEGDPLPDQLDRRLYRLVEAAFNLGQAAGLAQASQQLDNALGHDRQAWNRALNHTDTLKSTLPLIRQLLAQKPDPKVFFAEFSTKHADYYGVGKTCEQALDAIRRAVDTTLCADEIDEAMFTDDTNVFEMDFGEAYVDGRFIDNDGGTWPANDCRCDNDSK